MLSCPEFGTSQNPLELVMQLLWDVTGVHGQELVIVENNKVCEGLYPNRK